MRKLKILIVDFDKEASRYLSEFLKAEGFDVSEAADGEVGLEKCKAEMPDLVVVEPMISKLHGFELCSIITNDFNGKIPVVILTKFYREEQFKIEAMRSYGAAAFLSKPFRGPDILDTIKDLLKDKIEEDENEDTTEEIEVLDEILDEGLETLEIDTPPTKSKAPIEELDQELRESLIPKQKESEPSSVKVGVSKIDKMLEDTLSEFGLNIDKKEKPDAKDDIKFQAKMDSLFEDLANGRKTEESETLEPKVKKSAIKESQKKKEAVEDQIVKEPNRDKAEKEHVETSEPEVKEPKLTKPEEEMPDSGELEIEQVEKINQETTIFAAAIDEKEKRSILQTLKGSIPFIKKHPLKFLIPGVLIAAIAVSASFVFRKPSHQAPPPKQTTAELNRVKSQEITPREEIVKENSNYEEEPNPISTTNETDKESAEETKPADQTDQKGSVKTRVSQVFQVQESKDTPKPDINPIDVSEAVISTTPSEEMASPILTETEPAQIPERKTETDARPSTDTSDQNVFQQKPSPQTVDEKDNPPLSVKPKTKPGDLIPMSDVDIPPEIAKRVEPEYPSYALSRGVGGKVIFNVLISENGDVIETALLRGIKGPYGFNEECEKAIRQWKFVPAFKEGIKVKVWKTVSFTFKKT